MDRKIGPDLLVDAARPAGRVQTRKTLGLKMGWILNLGMGLGTREKRERQEELGYGGELATAPGHPFFKRLNGVLENGKFDRFCEKSCAGFYHRKLGRPSLPPGQYFRIMVIGFF